MAQDDEAARKEQAARWREQIRKIASPDRQKASEGPDAEGQAHPSEEEAADERRTSDESPPQESKRDFVRRTGSTENPRK
jgi:hypothetical protein